SLLNRTLTIKKEKSLLQINWLSSAEYFEREGYVELCFDPKLKPYLLQLKECFTQYQLGEILKLRSKYAFRLYELCKKNELLGKYKYEVEELRDLLGVEKGELKLWADFRRRCLEPAIKEINKKTDLHVSYEAKKLGRRFKWVVLKISKKKDKQSIKAIENDSPISDLLKLLPESERNKKTIQSALIKAYKKHGFEYCKRNIEYANEKATENYRVFLIKALKEDWALGWWEDKLQKEEKEKWYEKIKNAILKDEKGIEYKTNESGFIYLKKIDDRFVCLRDGVTPPVIVVDLVKKGKLKIVGNY
ncbi:RepB family plasmid replication initiator protein, partial [Caminibacter sp.]